MPKKNIEVKKIGTVEEGEEKVKTERSKESDSNNKKSENEGEKKNTEAQKLKPSDSNNSNKLIEMSEMGKVKGDPDSGEGGDSNEDKEDIELKNQDNKEKERKNSKNELREQKEKQEKEVVSPVEVNKVLLEEKSGNEELYQDSPVKSSPDKVDSSMVKREKEELALAKAEIKQRKREAKQIKKREEESLKREKQLMYDEYERNLEVSKDNNTLYADSDFFAKVQAYFDSHLHKHKSDIKPWWYKLSYVLFGPCQIAMFTGFCVGFMSGIREWVFDKKGAQFIFYETIYSIGNSHLVVAYLAIGANFYMTKNHEFSFKFRKVDHIALLVWRCLILPFLGVLYASIAYNANEDNKVVAFNAFIQWITPTSIDIITMVQAKEINTRDACISCAIQWVYLLIINTFAAVSPALRVIDL
eukprot:CAMPEP_0170517846 /NCGR_PEP_ID=MMETSP0209-20121228/3688_1 /TAXON_ID=665100 ORGANISM="Litonotus pictus, Strain P1" /NCGR_SAMPLE_ID=MMETSP0209 /ASSEMBLY_ACC=CAM_ASM_000301 /LENGTH=414 /DNA_ID=CAMNT_0010803199 /DNA_START=641 /DNA_END=1885 /DNA_ORIENTATION=-